MRQEGGLKHIFEAVEKLAAKHALHIEHYGENSERLTGLHETSDYHTFNSGVADRSASVRIGTETSVAGYGYLEERRPASDIDPYLVGALIADTVCLTERKIGPTLKAVKEFQVWKKAFEFPE